MPELSPILSLDRIKQVVIFRALAAGIFETMSSFFRDMELSWGNSRTAHATVRNGRRLIVLGKRFFAEKVKDENEAADVVFHEIMHHVFRHLSIDGLDGQYSHRIQNLAMDAIINAYLESIGCAGFMRRFYEDRDEYAFLRPGSKKFRISSKAKRLELLEKFQYLVRNTDIYGNGIDNLTTLEIWKRLRRHFKRVFPSQHREFYALRTTLEESLEFFQLYFSEPQGEEAPFLGGHGEPEEGSGEPGKGGGEPGEESGEPGEGGGKPRQGGDESEPFVSEDMAKQILQKIGAMPVSQKTRGNFAHVIRQITTMVRKPGAVRTGTRLSRRMPVRLCRQDLLSIETERNLFRRSQYVQRKVSIFFDISGSVAPYLPFVVGLIQTLRLSEFEITAYCWADMLKEVSFADLQKGIVPRDLGCGTYGEGVAKFIVDNHVQQAIIITDDAAGMLETTIPGKIHLCLTQGASAEYVSFRDKEKVPHCQVHQLALGSGR